MRRAVPAGGIRANACNRRVGQGKLVCVRAVTWLWNLGTGQAHIEFAPLHDGLNGEAGDKENANERCAEDYYLKHGSLCVLRTRS